MASPLVHQWWKTQLCNSVIDASGRVDHHSSRDDSRAAHQLECEEAHRTAPENLSVHQNKHRPLTALRGTFPCPNYTLKNKGASRCQRRTFLSKWFHKEPLTPEEHFWFTKASLRWKKVLQIKKKVRKKWFFTGIFDWMSLCGTKNVFSMASLQRTF